MQQEKRISPMFLTWIDYITEKENITSLQNLADYLNKQTGKAYTRAKIHDFKEGVRLLPDAIHLEISKDMANVLEFIGYKKLTAHQIAQKISFYEL